MSTSSYFMDVNPQYRDNGCPSQCMGMNDYTTVPNMYTFDTDPKTPLLSAGPMQPYGGVNSTMTTPQQAEELTNVTSAFGYVDPAETYREKLGAPSGLVYPISGSIKNRIGSNYALKDEGRLPSAVKAGYGLSYGPKVVGQSFSNSAPRNPITLSYARQ